MNRTELQSVTESLRTAVNAGDFGAISDGVAFLEHYSKDLQTEQEFIAELTANQAENCREEANPFGILRRMIALNLVEAIDGKIRLTADGRAKAIANQFTPDESDVLYHAIDWQDDGEERDEADEASKSAFLIMNRKQLDEAMGCR